MEVHCGRQCEMTETHKLSGPNHVLNHPQDANSQTQDEFQIIVLVKCGVELVLFS